MKLPTYRPFNFYNWINRALLAIGRQKDLAKKITKELVVREPADGKYSYTILALKPERFRNDLDILVANGFRVIQFRKGRQDKLLELILDSRIDLDNYYVPDPGSYTEKAQKKMRRLLAKVLTPFFEMNDIDCVLSAAIHFVDDLDFGVVISQELGIPWVVFHRECLVTNTGHYDAHFIRGKRLGQFQGDHIITHNESVRRPYIDSGFAPSDKIEALGCMRMDGFIEGIKQEKASPKKRKLVVLFGFHYCAGLNEICIGFQAKDRGFFKLFDNVNARFAKLAIQNPDVDFVIKPKWGGAWYEKLDLAFKKNDIDIDSIPNLTIDAELNAQDLIMQADVVTSFGSTTLLEAGIRNIPVILPIFDEAVDTDITDYVHFLHDQEAFEIAHSADEFESLLQSAIETSNVSDECLQLRRTIFTKYISPWEGHACEAYFRTLKQAIEKKKNNTL